MYVKRSSQAAAGRRDGSFVAAKRRNAPPTHRLGSCFAFVVIVFASASMAQPMPGQSVQNVSPSVSPDGTHIAFISNRDGMSDLYVIGSNGADEVRLTQTREEEDHPFWSIDGKHILFAVSTNDTSHIFSIDLDGTNQRQIGLVPGRDVVPAPRGRRVLYSVGTWTEVRLMVSRLDGSHAHQLTDGTSVVWGARWSMDGRIIAYTGRDASGVLHIFVMDADGSARRQLTHLSVAEGQAQMPAWCRDGHKLAFMTGDKSHVGHIWIIDMETGSTRKLAPHAQAYVDETPSWFPDGKRIAFQSDRTGQMEVWVTNEDGSDQRQITKD